MRIFRLIVFMLVLLVVPALAWSQDDANPHKDDPVTPPSWKSSVDGNPEPMGAAGDLTPGDPVPGFSVEASVGAHLTANDLKGHWSALVFELGGKPLRAMEAIADSVRALGVRFYGMSRDALPSAIDAGGRSPAMVMLTDPTGEISQLFGMYDDQDRHIRPGIVMVDSTATVRRVVKDTSLPPEEVLRIVRHTVRGD